MQYPIALKFGTQKGHKGASWYQIWLQNHKVINNYSEWCYHFFAFVKETDNQQNPQEKLH